MNDPKNIPSHVAIIMDGNGRWAKLRGLPKIAGHRAGARTTEEIISSSAKYGIKVLTLYTFSTENWKRPKHEIEALFGMLEEYLKKKSEELNKNNIKFFVTGDIEGLPEGVRNKLKKTIESTKDNTGLILNLALNYGARAEIIRAVRNIAADAAKNIVRTQDIDEGLFSRYLYTAGLPDPELLIRTSGEYRVSNFLLWQISYAELYITKKLWPDFKSGDLKRALNEFARRERRFGA